MRIHTFVAILSASLFAGACLSTESADPADTSTETSDVDGQLLCPPTHEKLTYRQFCKLLDQSQGAQTCTDKWTVDWSPVFPPPITCVEVSRTLDSHTCTACAPGGL
jgi:hypothetical protein